MKTTRADTLSICVQCGGSWQGDRRLCDCPRYTIEHRDGDFAMGPETMEIHPSQWRDLRESTGAKSNATNAANAYPITPAPMREPGPNRQQRRRAAKEPR